MTVLPGAKPGAGSGHARGEALVVIPDPIAWGQPYTRNLVAGLVDRGPVTILGISWCEGHESLFDPRAVICFADRMKGLWLASRLLALTIRFFAGIAEWIFPRTRVRQLADPHVLAVLSLVIRRSRAAHVVAVDAAALLACRLAGRRAHFVSLELLQYDMCWLATSDASVQSVVTQNNLRYDALFPLHQVPRFIVPNFPIYRPVDLPPRKEGLLFAGSVVPGFGVHAVVDYAAASGRELTILGRPTPQVRTELEEKYGELLSSGRIRIVEGYLPDDQYTREVARYRIAFSFYDLRRPQTFFGPGRSILPWSHLNYWTGFPGKIGVYAAAGVPVIVNDLPALRFVRERRIGVIVDALDPVTIGRAVADIEGSYEELSQNCVSLAKEYSFSSHGEPFVRFLEEQESLGNQ